MWQLTVTFVRYQYGPVEYNLNMSYAVHLPLAVHVAAAFRRMKHIPLT